MPARLSICHQGDCSLSSGFDPGEVVKRPAESLGWPQACSNRKTGVTFMAHGTAPFAHQLRTRGDLTPPEINALLFYRLGQFVVWGHQHTDLALTDPDFSTLLETATWALSCGGVGEPDNWIPPDTNLQIPAQILKRLDSTRKVSPLK